jgi:hypothetical protein
VKDPSRLMRFLWLLLADEGVPLPDMDGSARGEPTRGDAGARQMTNGLFEMLLRNLDRTPERLDHLSSLMKELRKGTEDEDLFPANFDAIWEPIWRQRERLRSRVQPGTAR